MISAGEDQMILDVYKMNTNPLLAFLFPTYIYFCFVSGFTSLHQHILGILDNGKKENQI